MCQQHDLIFHEVLKKIFSDQVSNFGWLDKQDILNDFQTSRVLFVILGILYGWYFFSLILLVWLILSGFGFTSSSLFYLVRSIFLVALVIRCSP
jgi:hypothetical protein